MSRRELHTEAGVEQAEEMMRGFELNPSVRLGRKPLRFHRGAISRLPSPEQMRSYAKERLARLGEGSDREVFLFGPAAVLKIAKNKRGREQNRQEARIGRNPDFASITARVLETSEDGESWLISELVVPFRNEEEFDERVMPSGDFEVLVPRMRRSPTLTEAVREMFLDMGLKVKLNLDYFRALRTSPVLLALHDLIHTYDLGIPDLLRPEHWGVAPDGRVALLDYGFRGAFFHRSNPRRNYRTSRDFWASVFAYALYRMDRMAASNVFRSIKSAGSDVGFDDASAIASQVAMMPEHQARELALVALGEYVRRSFTDASDALRWITQRDHRLGVWCAAQVARYALTTVRQRTKPRKNSRAAKALEAGERAVQAAEGWVMGTVTAEDAAESAASAAESAAAAAADPEYAAYSWAVSVRSAAYDAAGTAHDWADWGAERAADAVTDYATHAAPGYASISLEDLVSVVADAIPTYRAVARRNPRMSFEQCVAKMSSRPGVYSPRGLCAYMGRRKYGAERFAQMAAQGRRYAARVNPSKADIALGRYLANENLDPKRLRAIKNTLRWWDIEYDDFISTMETYGGSEYWPAALAYVVRRAFFAKEDRDLPEAVERHWNRIAQQVARKRKVPYTPGFGSWFSDSVRAQIEVEGISMSAAGDPDYRESFVYWMEDKARLLPSEE